MTNHTRTAAASAHSRSMTGDRERPARHAIEMMLVMAVGTAAVFAEDAMPLQPDLSPSMSWEQVARAMESYPPSFDHGDQRLMIMQSMDRLVCFSVKHISNEERSRRKPELEAMVQFYRQRVDRGLDALEMTRVSSGVHVFKFYSSSVIFKSAEGTVAVDFCQGPVNNGGEPEESDEYDSGFYLTPEQRNRVARLVDVALITHRHHDHADYSLARRLVASGKPVVGPAQLKKHWPKLASGIHVPQYGAVEQFGPCEIQSQFGYQYATSRLGPDGQRCGLHHADGPERSSETVRYLFRIGGTTFLQSAESQTEAHTWLEQAADDGWNVDMLLSPGQYQGARSVMDFLHGRDYFRLPVHEYELMHEGGGNRTASRLEGSGRASFEQQRAMPLLWGESFPLSAK